MVYLDSAGGDSVPFQYFPVDCRASASSDWMMEGCVGIAVVAPGTAAWESAVAAFWTGEGLSSGAISAGGLGLIRLTYPSARPAMPTPTYRLEYPSIIGELYFSAWGSERANWD